MVVWLREWEKLEREVIDNFLLFYCIIYLYYFDMLYGKIKVGMLGVL